MIFQFRALSGENESFLRDYEIRYDATLKEFHEFIAEDLGFDDEELASFFLCDEDWNKLQEYTLFDMGMDDIPEEENMPKAMSKVMLGQIVKKKHERLLYTFDIMGDRSLFIELMASKKEDEAEDYPRITASKGDAPAQFLEGEEEDEDIYKDIMNDFDEFEESYNDDEFGNEFGEFGSENENYY